MSTKRIELTDVSLTGEPTIQLVRLHESPRSHVKIASEALDYIKNVKPIPDKTVILVLAMTAGEFYGNNRNGDAWPERPLRVGPTEITADEVLPKHYQTFETDANVFRHHVNKDPAKSIGQVLKAFYNWPMHRVELLLALDNQLAENEVQRIEQGEFPGVSMGCKVRYDICSACGNKAPTRADYCDHAKYQLGELLSNGKRIFVWNPSPKFFDISMVTRPADRLGFMMKKVAEAVPEIWSSAEVGEREEDTERKVAALGKLALIQKLLSGQIAAAKDSAGEIRTLKNLADNVALPAAQQMPPLDDTIIEELVHYRPAQVFSTLSSLGIFLTTPEFIKLFVRQTAPHIVLPDDVLDRAVACQQRIFELLADNPQLLDDLEETGYLDIDPAQVNPTLLNKTAQLQERRSHHRPWLYKRAYQPGDFDLLTVTDPQTGVQYQTTQSVAKQTQGIARRTQAQKLLGGAGLLAGGMGLFGMGRGIPLRSPGGLALRLVGPSMMALGGRKLWQGATGFPTATADTGEDVYLRTPHFAGTELAEKRSSFIELSIPDAMLRSAVDFAHRPKARHIKIAALHHGECDLSFDEAALRIGKAICPDL